jgi:UDP-N-acetylmuramate dehydrogenase
VWGKPQGETCPDYTSLLLNAANVEGIPVFILGGGANLVVADHGIRGIVLDTGAWQGCCFCQAQAGHGYTRAISYSGTKVDDLVEAAALEGWGGLEFLAGMPGSLGGAVWMNARCYEQSVSDVLLETEFLDESFKRTVLRFRAEDYGYKKSPFQNRKVLILSATLRLNRRDSEDIQREMNQHRLDREQKGHYRFPSAGSAFKNSRDFGKPTGKIIDELGLRGISCGGAAVAPWHGNLIINTGHATAADIQTLVTTLIIKVRNALGIELEPEILFVGAYDATALVTE